MIMAYYQNRGGLFSNLPAATKNILIINIFMFILWLIRPSFMESAFALYYPTSANFHPWQFITYMFMHGGWAHIFFNMFALVMFGSQLESVWGSKKFLVFFFVTGIGAALLHTGVQWLQIEHFTRILEEGGVAASKAAQSIVMIRNIPTVGASGAIYGMLIGYAMLFPDSRLTLIFPPITLSAKWWVVIWVVMEILLGVNGRDGVAHFAHLGGMLFGYLLIKYWKDKGRMYDYED